MYSRATGQSVVATASFATFTASVAANALTVTLPAGVPLHFLGWLCHHVERDQRDGIERVHARHQQRRRGAFVWVAAMKNSGTLELAIINTWDGSNVYSIYPTDSISTTAEGGAGAAGFRARLVFDHGDGQASPSTFLGTWRSPRLRRARMGDFAKPDGRIRAERAASRCGSAKRRVQSAAVLAVGSTAVPLDDTIPQNTEGDSLNAALTDRTITARSALNIARITAAINFSRSRQRSNCSHRFQDAGANAIAVAATQTVAAGSNCNLTLDTKQS